MSVFADVWVHLVRQEPDIATHEDQGEPMEQVANWRAEDFDLDTTVMSCDFNLYSQSLVIFLIFGNMQCFHSRDAYF